MYWNIEDNPNNPFLLKRVDHHSTTTDFFKTLIKPEAIISRDVQEGLLTKKQIEIMSSSFEDATAM